MGERGGGGGGGTVTTSCSVGFFFMIAGVGLATIKLLTKPVSATSSSFTAKDIATKTPQLLS